MGAYHIPGSSVVFRERMPITIDNSAGGAGTAIDADITIPKDLESFWGVIDSAADKIRVTLADGVTLAAYDVDDGAGGAFSTSTRSGRIRIDGYPVPASTAGMFAGWLYYDPDGACADASVAVTMASIHAGYLEQSAPPLGPWSAVYQPQTPGATGPRDIRFKTPNEQVHIWARLDKALEQKRLISQGSPKHEEPWYCTEAVEDTSGADQTAMYTLTDARWVEHRQQLWLRQTIKAGSTGYYTWAPVIRTCLPFSGPALNQTLEPRIGFAVRPTRIET